MKKTAKMIFAGMTVVAFTFGVYTTNANEKVKVHHGDKVISISTKALGIHLAHGDTVHSGSCWCTM